MKSNSEVYKPFNASEPLRAAFLYQDPTLWPSWESLYVSLAGDKRFLTAVFQTEKAEYTYQRQKEFLHDIRVSSEIYSPKVLDEFDPHIIFMQTPYDYLGRPVSAYSLALKNKGIRIIYIPYGIEIVDTPSARFDHFRTPVIENAYRIYVLSEAFAAEYKKYCGNYKAVRVTGLPRFDMLCNKERFKQSDSLKKRINGRPVIVWHTHFAKISFINGKNRQITPYLDEYIRFARLISEYSNFFFIFLPHPKFGNDLSDDISNEKSNEVMRIIGELENAYIDKNDDYRPSLLIADAVITDRSSLMIEAAVCGGPVLLLQNADYQEQIIKPLRPLTDLYYHGTGCDDICTFLDRLIEKKDPQRYFREEAFRTCIPYTDGKCADRIKEDIYNSITTQKYDECEKNKLILFGTGFMYRKITENFHFPDNCEIVALADNDNKKWGNKQNGIKIIAPDTIQDINFDKVIIMTNGLTAEHVYKQLRFDLEIPSGKIVFCDYLVMLTQEERKV